MHTNVPATRMAWIALLATALGGCSCGGTDAADAGDADDGEAPGPGPGGWVVFRAARDLAALPMGDNLLANPDLEAGDATSFTGWNPYELGCSVETTTAHSPTRSARLSTTLETDALGLYQRVTLDQTEARPLYVAGWCRARSVTGEEDNDFSIYLDIEYTDGTPLYGQTIPCAVGTHDWVLGEKVVLPDKPIATVSYYVLFRRTHAGSGWFDDLQLREIRTDVTTFDGNLVYTEPTTPWPFEGSATVDAGSTGGPTLGLSAAGGAIVSLSTAAGDLHDASAAFASGFFVRDLGAGSDFLHFGGTVTATAGGATYAADDTSLGLGLQADFTAGTDRVGIDVTLRDLTNGTRALTLYFALPLAFDGWTWGDDIRTARTIAGGNELHNNVDVGFGATGEISFYPFASAAGTDGIALGYPLDRPAAVRFAANPHTHQLYAAIDVALSPLTAEAGTAHFGLVVFRHDPAWGFRAAAQQFYDLFPDHFVKRVDREGLWVAFSPLDPLTDIGDFGIAFHELGGSDQIAYDDTVAVLSFRYLTEPWSWWMTMPTDIPNTDEARVLEYLRTQLTAPEVSRQRYAQATLGCCSHDETGRCRFEPAAEPWCPYGAVFTLNPDPDIADPDYPLNKGNLAWNDDARAIYSDPSVGVQDGEYLDSLEAKAGVLDYRATHLAAANLPLVYDSALRPAVPEIWATYEFAKWVADEIHGMGKLMMANGALLSFAFPAHLFDVMGNERNWLWSGEFRPDPDSRFNFWRTLSYRKPFCTLMNTDFSVFDHAMVERYMQIELFYGVFPSMFSQNASENRYWDDPALVARDRDLFVKYVPLIVAIGTAGWEPLTYARTSDPEVYVERWGSGDQLYFTVRNTATTARGYDLAIEPAAVGLPATVPATFLEAISATSSIAAVRGTELVLTDTLPPEGVRLFHYIP
jgi:hypothetical protein